MPASAEVAACLNRTENRIDEVQPESDVNDAGQNEEINAEKFLKFGRNAGCNEPDPHNQVGQGKQHDADHNKGRGKFGVNQVISVNGLGEDPA